MSDVFMEKHEDFPERYHLERSVSHRGDYFFAGETYPELWKAKQRAAIIVATHKTTVGVRVWDTSEKKYVYHVDNPLIARVDVIKWGGISFDLPDEVWRMLGKD